MSIRLNRAIKEFGVGLQTLTDFLAQKGEGVSEDPNQKLTEKQYELLKKEFGADKDLRSKAEEMIQNRQDKKRSASAAAQKAEPEMVETVVPEELKPQLKPQGHIDLSQVGKPKPAPQAAPQPAAKPAAEAAKPAPAAAPAPQPAAAQPASAQKPAAAPAAKPAHQRPSVEERARAIGEEENGVFKLRTNTGLAGPKVLGTIDLSSINSTTRPKKKSKEDRRRERKATAQGGASAQAGTAAAGQQRKKRARIGNERVDVAAAANQPKQKGAQGQGKRRSDGQPQGGDNRQKQQGQAQGQNQQGASKRNAKDRNRRAKEVKTEVSEEDVAKQVKETLARLTNKQKGGKGAKYRKEKREQQQARAEEERREAKAESKILKLTEFVTANELAQMMDVPVTKVIGTCMSIGIMVSINQRMDAETIDLVAEEFGFKTEYVSADVQEAIAEVADAPEDLEPRAPIVTVMGHVDHGKTSLLDHIRKTNVIAGEAGGITQHIGAYNVRLENGRRITFLDTPGHEAFTAMRARGAQVTDIAIIIIAADDDIMPQTKEAISHAVAANVPIVFAINKVDKPHANPDKIKEGLAAMNFLVEDWGGKYQSQDISAKKGIGVDELLEKVLLEADMLELKANPNRKAVGTVIESSLDKGRGYVATVLVSNGTLKQGDVVLAGTN